MRADTFVRSKTTNDHIPTQELQSSQDRERLVRADTFVRSKTTNYHMRTQDRERVRAPRESVRECWRLGWLDF